MPKARAGWLLFNSKKPIPTMEPRENDLHILRAFALVDQCWDEVLRIKDALKQMLEEKLRNMPEDFPLRWVKESLESTATSNNGQVDTAIAVSFPLARKGRGYHKPSHCLQFEISLAQPGVPPSPRVPVIHVAFDTSPDPIDHSKNFYCHFAWFPEDLQGAKLIANRSFTLGDPQDVLKHDFYYILRLTDLTDQEMLERCVVTPVGELLSGVPVEQALPDDLPGLILFDDVNVLTAYNDGSDDQAGHRRKGRAEEDSEEDEAGAGAGPDAGPEGAPAAPAAAGQATGADGAAQPAPRH